MALIWGKTLLRAAQRCQQGQLSALPNFDAHGAAIHRVAVDVLLANWVALEADISWHSRQMQRCTATIAAVLHQPIDHIARQLIQQALRVSRTYALPGIPTPGSRLLTPRDAPTRRSMSPAHVHAYVAALLAQREQLELDTPVNTTHVDQLIPTTLSPSPAANQKHASHQQNHPETETTKTHDIKNPRLFKVHYTRLCDKPETFDTVGSIYHCLAQALQSGIGLHRSFILLMDKNKERLLIHAINHSAHETDPVEKAPLGSVALRPTNLFTRLIQKPTTLWVNATDVGRMMTLIPATFKTVTHNSDNFFIGSLGAPHHATTLIYADDGEDSPPLREAQFKLFKALCKAARPRLAP